MFIRDYLNDNSFNQTRIAKEFIKFNERCFIRLLGDMRSYNYVIDITPDFEASQFRARAIDFDQPSYDGRLVMYLPTLFQQHQPLLRSEEHTSELQSLIRTSYAVFSVQ